MADQYVTISHCIIGNGVGTSYTLPTSTGNGVTISETSPISFTYGDGTIDIRNLVTLLEFLLKKEGYGNDLLYTEHKSLVKILERDENLKIIES